MIITYNQGFLDNYYNSPDKNIKLSRIKLRETVVGDQVLTELTDLVNNSNVSPMVGYYELSGILSITGTLQLSITPSPSDLSVERYSEIYVLHDDLENPEAEPKIAFVISLEPGETLRRTVNMIDIPGFKPSCKVEFTRSSDTDKLEGAGQGRYSNIWGKGELDSYMTVESWDAYNKIYRFTDSGYDHLDVVSLDEYGLKIY